MDAGPAPRIQTGQTMIQTFGGNEMTDRIGHVRIWTCERCGTTVCEYTTEGDVPPTHCLANGIAVWKEARSC